MAEICIDCYQPIQDDGWLIGWSSDGTAHWRHHSCEPIDDPMEEESLPSCPIAQSVPFLLEASLEDSLPIEDQPSAGPTEVTYEVVSGSTIFRGEKLCDSLGYCYNVKRRRGNTIDWQCTMRRKDNRCPVTVCQKGNEFAARNTHTHPPAVGAAVTAKVCARVKEEAISNLFRPATAIVQKVLSEELTSAPIDSLPTVENMARAANRLRQTLRPKDPADLHFELATDWLPSDFLLGDVRVKDKRHFVFATSDQLRLLSRAFTWYIDGTFKLVHQPFTQLYTINIFVKEGSCVKQVPMVFIIMSGRKAKDYKKVLEVISNALPSPPSVKTIVADFEKAAWKSFRELFPQATMRGCVFHLSQAVFRKVKELGLQGPFLHDERIYNFVKLLMSLPFLPADRIGRNFRRLKRRARIPALEELVNYYEKNWIESSVWSPLEWSVYQEPIRTNNDIEGWHHALNKRADNQCQLPFYKLVEFLYEEVKTVRLQIRLVKAEKLRRIQRRKYREVQAKIFDLWGRYEAGELTSKQLLKAVSKLYSTPIE